MPRCCYVLNIETFSDIFKVHDIIVLSSIKRTDFWSVPLESVTNEPIKKSNLPIRFTIQSAVTDIC